MRRSTKRLPAYPNLEGLYTAPSKDGFLRPFLPESVLAVFEEVDEEVGWSEDAEKDPEVRKLYHLVRAGTRKGVTIWESTVRHVHLRVTSEPISLVQLQPGTNEI